MFTCLLAATAMSAVTIKETNAMPAKPVVEVCDPGMLDVIDPHAQVQPVATNLKFTEGPVWLPGAQTLLFSDIPANTIYQWTPAAGLSVFRSPSHNANGNILDREGRLITCEHGARRVTRTETNGTVTVLTAAYRGRAFNSPNDAVVKRDGTIWFTDPPYGLGTRDKEQDGNYVFRLDPGAAEPVIVARDFVMPNGLCFSPDESMLYIADSGAPRHIRRFRVTATNTLKDDGVFAAITPGAPDGIRVDARGRLFSTAGDGVHVFSPSGTLLGKIHTYESAANCCFGGPDGATLFITARTSVWRITLKSSIR